MTSTNYRSISGNINNGTVGLSSNNLGIVYLAKLHDCQFCSMDGRSTTFVDLSVRYRLLYSKNL